jgi:hypothetical protein
VDAKASGSRARTYRCKNWFAARKKHDMIVSGPWFFSLPLSFSLSSLSLAHILSSRHAPELRLMCDAPGFPPQVKQTAIEKYPNDCERQTDLIALNPFKGVGACDFRATANKNRKSEQVALSALSKLTHSATCPVAGAVVKGKVLRADPGLVACLETHGHRAKLKTIVGEAAKAGLGGDAASADVLYRAQRTVRKEMSATYELKFVELPRFLSTFLDANKGFSKVEVRADGTFVYAFLAFGAVHDALTVTGRPVLSTDFGHFKGDFEGLNATGMAQLGCGRLVALWSAVFASTNEDIFMWETCANLIKAAGMNDLYKGAVHYRDRHAGAERFEETLHVKWGM